MRARALVRPALVPLTLLLVTLALTSALAFAQGSSARAPAPQKKSESGAEKKAERRTVSGARAFIDAALQALANKDHAAAGESLERALLEVRAEAPLVIRKAVVVDAPPEGLGVYTEAVEGRVRDRQIWLYVEVESFGRRSLGPDTSEVELSVSGSFSLEDGTSIGTMSLGQHAYRTHTPHAVTFFGPQLKLSDKAPAGAYLIDLTVTDAVTKKQAKKKVRFVIPG